MRPLRLTLQAFGPFPDRTEIDLELLSGRLFLIHGPTGSGKSTLLDGISLALFGQPAFPDRPIRSLRSHLADPAETAQVELEFALGPERYRVWRQPAQERARRRGEGTVQVPPKATLWRLRPDRPEEVLASGAGKVTRAVEELLGMAGEQFRQVVMIPQGEFRKLLTASSNERQQILQILFGTRRYKEIERALRERTHRLAKELERYRDDEKVVLEQAQVASAEELLSRQADLAERLAELKVEIERLQEEHRRSRVALEEGRRSAERLAELERARGAMAELEARREAHQIREIEAEAAQRAARVEPQEQRLLERNQVAERAQGAVGEARSVRERAETTRMQQQERLRAEAARESEIEVAGRELARLEGLAQQAAGLAGAVRQEARAERELAEARTERGAAELERVQREEALDEAEQRHSRGLDRALRGRAASLAASLEPGQPCPVCGSREHPVPAGAEEAIPSEAELDQAHRAASAAGEHVLESRKREARVREVEHRLEERLETARRAVTEQQEAVPEELREPGALGARREQLERGIRERRQALEQARAGDTASEAALAAAGAAEGAAGEALRQALLEQNQARIEWEQALEEARFTSREEFHRARRSGAIRDSLAAELGRFREEESATRDRLRRAQEAARDRTAPDLPALEEETAGWAHRLASRQEEAGGLQERWKGLETARNKLAELARLHRQGEERHGPLARLSAATSGRLGAGLTLEGFVLSTRLDEVAAVAGQRLLRMSQGRYSLHRAVERSDRRSTGGLDLEVMDAYTGTARPVASLSGGESFQAALSLALGLADVVQAHAGGIRLETIFIDEGFGTLDPEALDQALRALVELQQEGRLVGVISHVPELRERIDCGLEILNRQGRSRVVALRGKR